MNDYISKPLDAGLLLSKLDELAATLSASAAKQGGINENSSTEMAPDTAGEATIRQVTRPTVEGTPQFAVTGVDLGQLEALRAALLPSAFAEQLSLLLATFIPGVERIGEHLSSGNLAESAKEAHDLVSTAGNFGAIHVSELARQLEQACKRSDTTKADSCYGELRSAAELAAAAFQEIRRSA